MTDVTTNDFSHTVAPTPLTADTSGSDFSFTTYDIAPEDQELAASLANFDPIDDVPSPVQFDGGPFKVPSRFSATALPPHLREEVMQQLNGLPAGELRDQREHEFTIVALRKNALETRIRLGAGPGANTLQRETFALASERRQLEMEAQGLLNSLAEVARIEVTGINEQTGEQLTKTVYRVEGEARRQSELRHATLMRHLDALDGVEGQRRLSKALFEAVESEKAIRSQLDVHARAKVRAAEMLEEEEVERLATTFAANRRNTVR